MNARNSSVVVCLVLLLIAGCTAVPDPVATPANPAADLATVESTRPLATSTPRPPTATITPTEILTIKRTTSVTVPIANQTTIPTLTPSPVVTPTPNPNIFNVTLSSQGQLAFIQNNILLVETAPISGEFLEIGQFVQTATWSPDGTQLFYSQIDPQRTNSERIVYEQRLWSSQDLSDHSLARLIPNYPDPPYQVIEAYWSPDGTKILLQALIDEDERHEEAQPSLFSFLLATVDLSTA